MSDGALRRVRRYDPQRRDRIVAAALDVIAEHGAEGASHRAIARAADVPLGSTTYHFSTIEDLLVAAFSRHADALASLYEARMRTAESPAAALDALADHVGEDLLGSERELVLTLELYAAAALRPGMRTVTETWMRRSRRALELHFDPVTARELDALVGGLLLHSALSTEPMTSEQVRHALRRSSTPSTACGASTRCSAP